MLQRPGRSHSPLLCAETLPAQPSSNDSDMARGGGPTQATPLGCFLLAATLPPHREFFLQGGSQQHGKGACSGPRPLLDPSGLWHEGGLAYKAWAYTRMPRDAL